MEARRESRYQWLDSAVVTWAHPSYMEFVAGLEDSVELLRELVESECDTFFSGGCEFRGGY